MSGSTPSSEQEVWRGRPWILPYVAIRTVLVALIAVGVLFVESSMGVLNVSKFDLPVQVWTLIAFFLAWFICVFDLLVLRSTNFYVLRVDSLEIKVGLFTTKTSVIVPTGFSDLEVIRSVSSRVLNTGEIKIKTQSERDFTKRMVKVRDPMRVANLIRDVMARQIFKLDAGSSGKNS
ncbi:MAG: PH domain-containing protein [Candidatus Bathyarchaeota archaeon]|nr:PH domain-containing protein [Candidatus Bathyarchaeota archaeon]